jgi:hypothetical protein
MLYEINVICEKIKNRHIVITEYAGRKGFFFG